MSDIEPEDDDKTKFSSWYERFTSVYLDGIEPDEVRRFLCLEMATQVAPGKEAVNHAKEYERYLIGRGPKVVE